VSGSANHGGRPHRGVPGDRSGRHRAQGHGGRAATARLMESAREPPDQEEERDPSQPWHLSGVHAELRAQNGGAGSAAGTLRTVHLNAPGIPHSV